MKWIDIMVNFSRVNLSSKIEWRRKNSNEIAGKLLKAYHNSIHFTWFLLCERAFIHLAKVSKPSCNSSNSHASCANS